MARPDFQSQILQSLDLIRRRNEAVMRTSVQRVIEIAQTPEGQGGNLPRDTGFLRSSLVVSETLPATRAKPKNGRFEYNASAAALAIASWAFREPLRAAYTANYAAALHYGARGLAARPWVALAAQRWPQIVAEVAAEVRSISK